MLMCCLLQVCCDSPAEAQEKVARFLIESHGLTREQADGVARWLWDLLEPVRPFAQWIATHARGNR